MTPEQRGRVGSSDPAAAVRQPLLGSVGRRWLKDGHAVRLPARLAYGNKKVAGVFSAKIELERCERWGPPARIAASN